MIAARVLACVPRAGRSPYWRIMARLQAAAPGVLDLVKAGGVWGVRTAHGTLWTPFGRLDEELYPWERYALAAMTRGEWDGR